MVYTNNGTTIEQYLKENISTKRYEHILSVAKETQKLCDIFGGNKEKCYIAAMFHDLAKEFTDEEFFEAIKKYNLKEEYYDNLKVVHGKVAEKLMIEEWNVENQEILDAVSFHTTGRANMTQTDKIVFIADGIEPLRTYDRVDELREIAYKDLDKACLWYLTENIKILESMGIKVIDEDTIKAKEWFESII